MKDSTPEPLEPELSRLFEAERDFSDASAESHARVWRGIETALLVPPPDGGGEAPPPSPGELLKAFGAGKLALASAALIAAGAAGGVALDRSMTRASAPPATATMQVRSSEPAVPPSAKADITPPSVAPSAPTSAAPPRPSSQAGLRASDDDQPSSLARERAIIEAARAGLSRGRPDAALAALGRHAREFPRGSLTEEREGLNILALARSGRLAEARVALPPFRRRYPHSLLLPTLDAAVAP